MRVVLLCCSHWLEAACAAGLPDALFEKGHALLTGSDGYAKDEAGALALFMSAGESGHADALCSAGAMHFKGFGVPVVS